MYKEAKSFYDVIKPSENTEQAIVMLNREI